jgi:hypothetical protein
MRNVSQLNGDDLRGNDDRYTPSGSGAKRITWRFGDL